ncbi:hypothetical protein BC826DRAFT_159351 [Russula brevipes]|nr:hypothetical protein BC826DRAFT_159351 [Russula brevipes]
MGIYIGYRSDKLCSPRKTREDEERRIRCPRNVLETTRTTMAWHHVVGISWTRAVCCSVRTVSYVETLEARVIGGPRDVMPRISHFCYRSALNRSRTWGTVSVVATCVGLAVTSYYGDHRWNCGSSVVHRTCQRSFGNLPLEVGIYCRIFGKLWNVRI